MRTVRHLIKQSRSNLILARGEAAPPANNPPVWDSQPAPVFVQGTASNYDFDDISSDPDLDTITTTLNTGAVSLSIGVTYNSTEKRLEYDGVGAIATTTGHIATLDDGTDTTASDPFDIKIIQQSTMDNWPLIAASRAIANVNDRLDNNPMKRVIEASNCFIHQGLFVATSAERASTSARFTTIEANNPEIIWVMHISLLNIEFDIQATIRPIKFLETQLYANPSDFDDYLLRETAGGAFIAHRGAESGFALNWACSTTVRQRIVDGLIDMLADGGGANNLLADHNVYWMQDVMPEIDSRYKDACHSGTITAEFSSTEIDVPTWTNPGTDGNPDGDGYEGLTGNTKELVVLDSAKTAADISEITGHKVVNGTTDRLRLNTALENLTVSSGDIFSVLPKSSTECGSSGGGEVGRAAIRQGCVDFMTDYKTRSLSQHGASVGPAHNGGAANWTKVRDEGGSAIHPSEFVGFWEFEEHERCGQVLGFFQAFHTGYYVSRQDPPGGSTGGTNYDPDDLIKAFEYNKLMLMDDASAAGGYPCVWVNPQTRSIGSGNTVAHYQALTELDWAYCMFWACFSWCNDNLMPLLEIDEGHDLSLMLAEQMISAGNPVTTRGFATSYTPATNTLVRKTADFGTHGYIFEFDNILIFINIRAPDNTAIPWIPHYLSGGQAINPTLDVATVPSAGAGNKWQRYNHLTYTNNDPSSKYNGLQVSDYSDAEPLTGPTQHDGTDLGATVQVGALETLIALKVPV